MERDDRQRREQLRRRRDRDHRSAGALAQERRQQRQRAPVRLRQLGVEDERLAAPKQCEQVAPRQLLRSREQSPRRRIDPLVIHVNRPCCQLDPALVGHADHRRINAEQLDDRRRQDVERRLQREALRERARDLVLRVQPLRLLLLRGERLREIVVEPGHPLVQPGVLDRHRQLPREGRQQRPLVLAQQAPLPGVDGENPDRLVADDETEREDRADARLLEVGPNLREPVVARRVELGDHARLARLERRRQQGVGDRLVRALDSAARCDG
jgi:hypothetical protein